MVSTGSVSAQRVADTTPSIDRIDQHLEIDAYRADENWEERLTLILVPAGFDTDWLDFSDACIMQSRVRGGSHQLDPWKWKQGRLLVEQSCGLTGSEN